MPIFNSVNFHKNMKFNFDLNSYIFMHNFKYIEGGITGVIILFNVVI